MDKVYLKDEKYRKRYNRGSRKNSKLPSVKPKEYEKHMNRVYQLSSIEKLMRDFGLANRTKNPISNTR